MGIQLTGLASGIDTASLVTQLVQANSGTLNQLQQHSSDLSAANSTLSGIGTQLSALSSAAAALADSTQNGSFTASSSSTTVGVTADATAQPGTYAVQVNQIAAAQRTYSASFASSSTALNQTGSFTVQVGSGTAATINVDPTDTLQSLVTKINGAGLQVTASVFDDGTTSRLQIRGMGTGKVNALTFTENGTSLDLNGTGATPTSGKTVQQATDASLTIDGFTVTRPTNQVTGAVNGLTLNVTDTTTAPVSVVVQSDSSGIAKNLNAVVSAYNSVVQSIQKATGYGTTAASNPILAGDSALRQIQRNLASAMGDQSTQSGALTSLADIGLTLQKDGTLALDSTKLSDQFTTDPRSVENLLGRLHNSTTGGLMANLNDLVTNMTQSGGTLTAREDSFTAQKKTADDRATEEQTRLDQYQTQLQQQFSAMETTYSANQSLIAQLQKI